EAARRTTADAARRASRATADRSDNERERNDEARTRERANAAKALSGERSDGDQRRNAHRSSVYNAGPWLCNTPRVDAWCTAEADGATPKKTTKPEIVGPNETKLTGPPPATITK